MSEGEEIRDSNNSQFSIPNVANFVSVRLNGENYLCWKYQLMTVLKIFGLQKHVDSAHIPSSTPPEAVDRWSKEDNFVSACINSTIDPSIAHLAIDTNSAAELWKVIEDSYLQQAFAKRSQLKTQFQSIKQGSDSITSYCDSIKKICDSLRSIGEAVSEGDLVLQTLHGLNSSYNMFVLNIENSEIQPSFAQLRSRLLMYEERMLQQESPPVSAMSALKVDQSPPHVVVKENSGVVCQICRKNGHSADRCYFRYAPSNDRSRDSFGNGRGRNSNQNGWRGSRGYRGGRSGGRIPGNGLNTGRWMNPNFYQNNNGGGYFTSVNSGFGAGYSDPQGFGFNSHAAPVFTGPGQSEVGHQIPLDPQLNYSSSNGGNIHGAGGYESGGNSGSHFNGSGSMSQAFSADFGQAHFAKWAAQQASESMSFSDTCAMVDSWIPDSGATTHMTPNPQLVQGAVAYTGPERVIVGNDEHRASTPPHSA